MIFERFRALFGKKKTPEELNEHYDNIELEKGDFLAMLIAAFITFIPVILITLFVLFGLLWILF
jgi:hypothetical protein